MATYYLTNMGEPFDSACRPAGCRISTLDNPIKDGLMNIAAKQDKVLFYDPQTPGVIFEKQTSNDRVESICQNGDRLINLTTGLMYEFHTSNVLKAIGFTSPEQTYIINNAILGSIVMPANCTLIFQGGQISGSLIGNNTTIDAPPVHIFDSGIILGGTFTNEYAYPEWWGAIATETRSSENQPITDCEPAIQAAFNSPFYRLEFATGFYYIGKTLKLNKRKHIHMQGGGVCGLWDRTIKDSALGTVIWTSNKDSALEVNLGMEIILNDNQVPTKHDEHARLIWDGGCIDVSYYGRFHYSADDNETMLDNPAILYCPRAEEDSELNLALRGPMPYYSSETIHTINDFSRFGIGILITNDSDTTVKQSGMVLSNFNINIFGFSTGIYVNYERYKDDTYQGALTSLSVHGLISRCFRYIYAPAGGFAGGVIDCSIQTGFQNQIIPASQEPIYLLDGDFHGCYINSWIWDYPYSYALRSTDTELMRLGPKMLDILSNPKYHMMMPSGNLSGLINESDGLLNATIGNYDLLQLSSFFPITQARNYVHLIDNDLLSYDKIWGQADRSGYEIQVEYKNLANVIIHNDSPLDREGFRMFFDKDTEPGSDFDNATLRVTIPMPTLLGLEENNVRILFMAVHLKSATYTHFSKLTASITLNDNTTITLHEGPYTDKAIGGNDIILPLLPHNTYRLYPDDKIVKNISFLFEKVVKRSAIWEKYGIGHYSDTFRFAVEGRFNIHSHNNIWSASGGDLGRDILRLGSPYLLGSKKCITIGHLPSDASLGAIGLVNDTYPVVKTPRGWMIQELAGTTSELNALPNTIGELSIGQSAFNTTLGKPVWWNGNVWVDATGSTT